MDPCIVVGLSKNTNKMQLVTEFIISKFIKSLTRFFEQYTAQHQELWTVFTAYGLYTHVVTGRSQGSALTTACHHKGI
jgi:hypothetical protein